MSEAFALATRDSISPISRLNNFIVARVPKCISCMSFVSQFDESGILPFPPNNELIVAFWYPDHSRHISQDNIPGCPVPKHIFAQQSDMISPCTNDEYFSGHLCSVEVYISSRKNKFRKKLTPAYEWPASRYACVHCLYMLCRYIQWIRSSAPRQLMWWSIFYFLFRERFILKFYWCILPENK